uniref:Uncharacterized protein n=1 Tax=Plectus sambesii TaxID=2011161 RepID=A0A914VME8_9BILA
MSSTNLTDVVKSLSNLTVNNPVIGPVTTWETRLQAYWQHLFGY